jgi:hypothetical protein
VALTETLAPSRVATHLRLGVADLKKQIALRQPEPAQNAVAPGFVELPPAPVAPASRQDFELDLQRADGARLRLEAQGSAALAVTAIIQRFLEAD